MKKSFLFLTFAVITAISLFSLTSCGDDDDEGINSNDVAVTGKVSEITAFSAVINGKVNADLITATYSKLEMGIEVSESPEFSFPKRFKAYELIGKTISVSVTGLKPKTKYYYRTYVDISSSFAYYGKTSSFTTSDISSSGGTDNGHNYVDLALPSGTKWATCNIGASKPEEYGGYYAWGEIETKSDYSWSTYKYGNDWNELTKYCTSSSYGKDGFTDNKFELVLDDDVAHKQWGGQWRMPSEEQFEELLSNTTSQWVTVNGKEGRLFTASNGNSIFLPAAGGRLGTSLSYAGSYGVYWSSSLDSNGPFIAYSLRFRSSDVDVYDGYSRYGGKPVRPVRP